MQIEIDDIRNGKLGNLYFSRAISTGADIRNRNISENQSAHDIYIQTIGVCISLNIQVQGLPYESSDEKVRGQMFLVSYMVKSSLILNSSILEGHYTSAAALLKQKLESIAAFDEYEKGKRRDGRTPNIGNTLPRFAFSYSQLNNIAHPSRLDSLEEFNHWTDGEKYVPAFINDYNFYTARQFLLLDLLLTVQVAARSEKAFKDAFGVQMREEELLVLRGAIDLLRAEKFIK